MTLASFSNNSAVSVLVCGQVELYVQQRGAPSVEAALRAIYTAHHARVPVMLNYAPVGSMPIPINNQIACLVVNETEAAQLTGQEVKTDAQVRSAAAQLTSMGPSVVIITLGPQGSFVRHSKHELLVPPFNVKAVDTTAAGDAFVGAFAVALSEGHSTPDAAAWGNAAGALAVTRAGAQPSLPTRAELEQFLA